MDQFRPAQNDKADDPRPSSSAFTPPSIIRPESTSAFSKPILPTSSSLLSPRPQFGAPISTSNGFGSSPDPLTTAIRYRECLRNHAASLGGHVTDGCGEFMPAGPADPLKCAACGCHRSFHRRESPKPDNPKLSLPSYRVPLLLPPPNPNPNPNPIPNSQSSSEEKNNGYVASVTANVSNVEGYRVGLQSGEARKKRFRTKFSPEQKEKMRAFAGRVGWRIHKKDEGEMERFCNEIGVSRQVVKVWMHNNKHLVTKKQDGDDQEREVKVEGEHQNQVDGV